MGLTKIRPSFFIVKRFMLVLFSPVFLFSIARKSLFLEALTFGSMAGIDSTSKVHKNCVCGIYPQSKVKRYEVTADKIKWTIQFPEYSPPNYTSEKLKGASYADPDIELSTFREHVAYSAYLLL